MAATGAASSSNRLIVPLAPSEIPAQIDLLISLHLHLWSALTIAVQNTWGTSNPQVSADKRDWLAGAISDLFAQNQLRDLEDLEDVLEQVMSDEFEVVVDDGSLEEVSRKIWKGVENVRHGEGAEVKQLMAMWEEKKCKGEIISIVNGSTGRNDQTGSSSDEDDDEEWNGSHDTPVNDGVTDVNMDDAPELINASKKPEPEVDEDGFTKVVSKKKR